ncbi:hypothetical protein ACFL6T_01065 [Candidatus Zixiibacteriota bacterium]
MSHAINRIQAIVIYTGATLLLICAILPIVVLDSADIPYSWINSAMWPVLSILAFVLAALLPFIMLIIYIHQIEETGKLGLCGLVLTIIGLLLLLGFQFDITFVWPTLASTSPELVDFNGPLFQDPRFEFIHGLMDPLHTAGMAIFGISLIRARVLPRTASTLLMIGAILSAGILLPPLILRCIGGLAQTVALVWIGLKLLLYSKPATEATQQAHAADIGSN